MQRRIPAADMDTMFDDATAKLEKHGLLVSEVDSQCVESLVSDLFLLEQRLTNNF